MATVTRSAEKAASAQRLKKVQRAATLIKQVSDPTRLQVILRLTEGELHVSALSEDLKMSQPAVSHHLALLKHGGIICPRRQGKNNYYSLTRMGNELARLAREVIA